MWKPLLIGEAISSKYADLEVSFNSEEVSIWYVYYRIVHKTICEGHFIDITDDEDLDDKNCNQQKKNDQKKKFLAVVAKFTCGGLDNLVVEGFSHYEVIVRVRAAGHFKIFVFSNLQL